ncbi:MAG: RNA polymerase sporulation sigma factor SigH [Firmicutes bacterium]|nr:RNA polymerase sporulation sigma factor SigH [Bacillota bacterium]
MKDKIIFTRYKALEDGELIEKIKTGDMLAQESLIDRYKKVVRIKARGYYIMGGDTEDIIQEGMIGLYKAIRDFDAEKQVNFYSFAVLCITRQINTAIKSANRQKHIPLNSSLSLDRSVYEENDDFTYLETLANSEITNPENLVISNENKSMLEKKIGDSLSDLEKQVLSLYLRGKSYAEIAGIIGKDEKSIDNALQRIKKKIIKILDKTG